MDVVFRTFVMVKSFFYFLYILLAFVLVTFILDQFFLHLNLISFPSIFFITILLLIVIYSPQISEFRFMNFIIKKIVKEQMDKYFELKIISDKIKEVGRGLENISGAQIDGDEVEKLKEVYAIPKLYKDKLSKEEIEELRQLWNKYILRELASHCLALFDKESFGVKERESDKIKQSPDVYFPSPDRVLALSRKAGFEQKMKKDGNDKAIEQFKVVFEHFQSSYHKSKDGDWLEWDWPKKASEMQVKKKKNPFFNYSKAIK